jgi:hypothetical protein
MWRSGSATYIGLYRHDAIPISNNHIRLLRKNKTWMMTLSVCAACCKIECSLLQRHSLVLIEFLSLTVRVLQLTATIYHIPSQ